MDRVKYVTPDIEALKECLFADILEASGEGGRNPYGDAEQFNW